LKRDGEFVGVDGYVVGIRSLVKKRLRLHFLASGAVAAEVGGNAFADEEAIETFKSLAMPFRRRSWESLR